ncbi:MAG: hypothetical protein ACRDBG_15865 [Waterburya sp.]
MPLSIEIDTKEIEKVAAQMQSISIKAQDITAASVGIKLLIQEDVDFRFQNAPRTETGGEVWGGEYWDELTTRYLKSNPRRSNGQILRDTGELQQSMTIEGHPFEAWSVTEEELVFGTALAKAGRLQRKRPFIFWHPVLLEKVAQYLVNFIAG